MPSTLNVVWIKRDLRMEDHEPLAWAEQAGIPYLIVFCFEPELYALADTSDRHLQFQFDSLTHMNQLLSAFNHRVHIFDASIIEVLQYIHQKFSTQHLYSYQESGIQATWDRDKAVNRWCKKNGVVWKECPKNGIRRAFQHRKGWEEHWIKHMTTPMVMNAFDPKKAVHLTIPSDWIFKPPQERLLPPFQPAGTEAGKKYLKSFLMERGVNYTRHISRPAESRISCSRVSPYLAWGNLSLRHVWQVTQWTIAHTARSKPFKDFSARLEWNSHFTQKMEDEVRYENECINRGYEQMILEYRPDLIEAWKMGTTGFPLVDANMRCVKETGWINFRMRSMVVSFFCHYLLQDWRHGVHYLAQQFLDYDPGIHYPQFQMQAGVTGVNIIRMYNPVLNGQKYDPEGEFIKKWIPELRGVDPVFIHEPWLNPEISFTTGYPLPAFDATKNVQRAKELYWGMREDQQVKSEGRRIVEVHAKIGRRKEG